ncbi:hypothetical protein FUAX_48010 (plasmid) [Fulvitalea axinellae]|uniref:Uncharacterized protein n=1 Tax=Fulvitalea axinellae TaxID=1182444 RepID=A0AAU9D0Z3_9BACT|nr:hypothetical protein FUAX_48010 [Fulvitalea axinellae]
MKKLNAVWLGLVAMLFLACETENPNKLPLIIDQVQHNPGEAMTNTSFMDPEKLASFGYDGQVLTDYVFVQTLITWDDFDKRIFPEGSEGRKWVEDKATAFDQRLKKAHKAGIKFLCQPDVLVFPKTLVELYKDEICDDQGRVTFDKEKTWEIYRYMINAIFKRFPDLDGFVVRTGETYLTNIPYHTGNGPYKGSWKPGKKKNVLQTRLINMFREELCEKRDKTLVYRTWGYLHSRPEEYLDVTDKVEPHEKLFFSIKHQNGDFHRGTPYNKTIGIGKHQQIVEIQCQREYEGKGTHPNYIAKGVIEGFEEYGKSDYSPSSLKDLLNNPIFKGVWTWSRGGGWVGPYIENEIWPELNAYVLSAWANDTSRSEEEIFGEYMTKIGIHDEDSRKNFREMCLLSPKGVIRGHNSLVQNISPWWLRDQFMGGNRLVKELKKIHKEGNTEKVLAEKRECLAIWENIVSLSNKIKSDNEANDKFFKVSAVYGLIKYRIIAEGWTILLKGMEGDETGIYDKQAIAEAIRRYDQHWKDFAKLKEDNPDCPTIYTPYEFLYKKPHYQSGTKGMKFEVDRYRWTLEEDGNKVNV